MTDAEPSNPYAGSRQSGRTADYTQGRQRPWLAPAGVGAAALAVFLLTLAPTVAAEDSGELIAAAWHFGIPHPPGYLLWTILCGAFLHAFAVGAVAFRANLFSALCSSAAAVVAYAALREMKLSKPAAASGALVWIWSYWSWSQSVITEVYPLNSLFTAALLWCAMRWRSTGDSRHLLRASLLFGLGMSNHHTLALAALALILWVLFQEPGLLVRWKLVLKSLAAFAVGLLPYVYLPIRAAADPPMNWGNPSNRQRFVAHVTRESYGALGPLAAAEPRSIARFGQQLAYLGNSVVDDMTPWLTGLAALGMVVMARRDRRALVLAALWLLTTGVLYALLANYDFDVVSQWATRVFLIPMMLGIAIPIAFAQECGLDRCRRAFMGYPPLRLAGAVMIAILPPGIQLVSHWRVCNYSNYWYAHDHARNLLACMEPNAIVFPRSDHSAFSLAYLTMVEGWRSDVRIADLYGGGESELLAGRPPDAPGALAAPHIQHEGRPVYFTTKTQWPAVNARLVSAGPLYRWLAPGEPFDRRGLLERCRYRNWDDPSALDSGARYILCEFEFFAGLDALEAGLVGAALERFEKAAALRPLTNELHNNIGSALAEKGRRAEAIPYFENAARIDPRYLTPRRNLAKLYLDQGRTLDAKRLLEEIIRISPDDFWAYRQLGSLHDRWLGERERAMYYWRESLRRNPDQPDLRALLRTQQED